MGLRRHRLGASFAGATFRYGGLTAIAILILLPLAFAFFGSFKSLKELLTEGSTLLPAEWHLTNYTEALTKARFGRYFINSLTVASIVVVFDVIAASMAGYALARLRVPGRRAIEGVLAASILLGFGTATLYPRLVIAQWFGIVNLLGIALVQLSGLMVVHVLIARAFCGSLPNELEEAARVDGCGPFKAFWYIMFPLMRPIAGTIGILAFQASWNGFQVPLVFTLFSPEMRTVTVGVYALGAAVEGTREYGQLLAGAMIAILPLVLMFFILQPYLVRGLTQGAVKG
jgi:ABC-type glycerol-3-phosphate transport system permease component